MDADGYMTSSASSQNAITRSKHQSKDSEKGSKSTVLLSVVLRLLILNYVSFARQPNHPNRGLNKRNTVWVLYLMESEKRVCFMVSLNES